MEMQRHVQLHCLPALILGLGCKTLLVTYPGRHCAFREDIQQSPGEFDILRGDCMVPYRSRYRDPYHLDPHSPRQNARIDTVPLFRF